MTFLRSFLLACPAACLLAQTPAPTAAPKPAAPKPAAAKPMAKKAVTPAKPAAAKPAAAKPAAKPTVTATTPATPPANEPPGMLAKLPRDKVVLTIGDEKVTAGEFDRIVAALPEQARAQAMGPGKKQLVENFIKVKVLAQEAKRRKLDQTKLFQTQVAMQMDQLLASATYRNLEETAPVTEDVLMKYYNEHKGEFETARASHILIRFKGSPAPVRPGQQELSEEEALAKANQIRQQLLTGGDFGEIARKESDDGGSGVQGGSLGTFGRGQMVPAFEEAVFSQPLGQVGAPVKTNFGFHLIKVEERETKTVAQAKAAIEKKMRPEVAMKAVETLRQNTNVVIAPELSGDAMPAPPLAPPPAAKK